MSTKSIHPPTAQPARHHINVLGQLLNYIPRSIINKAAIEHGVEARARTFSMFRGSGRLSGGGGGCKIPTQHLRDTVERLFSAPQSGRRLSGITEKRFATETPSQLAICCLCRRGRKRPASHSLIVQTETSSSFANPTCVMPHLNRCWRMRSPICFASVESASLSKYLNEYRSTRLFGGRNRSTWNTQIAIKIPGYRDATTSW